MFEGLVDVFATFWEDKVTSIFVVQDTNVKYR